MVKDALELAHSDLVVRGVTTTCRLAADSSTVRGDRVQWQQSYVAGDKTFCVYLADGEESVREHSRLSGFPANKITEIRGVIDPATAN